ncbi:hypothetical protein N7462_002970 [Penicillium macrosclerotiorum]|uniref:uncharacterized protein n=1 Tax=Penicillium macrosclerotiorum TaxID=303699 RepID=UPI002547E70E|nr:uncharacterized protein N7462_002970 [Penicillium macrosclerotiorum]KAJ5688578.1 hypothetical protein N7462_002970 [Penicillium macrosclerotiorum]
METKPGRVDPHRDYLYVLRTLDGIWSMEYFVQMPPMDIHTDIHIVQTLRAQSSRSGDCPKRQIHPYPPSTHYTFTIVY